MHEGITVAEILKYCESQRHPPETILASCCCGSCKIANLIRCAQKEAGRQAALSPTPEIDRLRTVIEGAPHGPDCAVMKWHPGDWPLPSRPRPECTCWKAALNPKGGDPR